MDTLKKRLLATIDNHGKCDIRGIFNLYPREKKFSVYRALFELNGGGWVKIRKSRVFDGVKIPEPNVSRTKKQMYKQSTLF